MENNNNKNYSLDSLKLYLKEVRKEPLLEEDEEKEILESIYNFNNILKENNISLENIKIRFNKLNLTYNNNQSINLKEINKHINGKKNINLKELNNLKEEIELYEEYMSLIKNFMKANLRIVIGIAKGFKTNSILELIDLIQEGNIGLREAIEKYDINKNVKFITYATPWIRKSIISYISKNKRVFGIPSTARIFLHKIEKTEKILEQKLMRKPTDEELLEEFNNYLISNNYRINKLTLKEFNNLKRFNDPTISLDIKTDEEESTLVDFISDDINVEKEGINSVIKDNIKEILSVLDNKSKLILILRNGLCLKDYMTYDDYISIIKTIDELKQEYYEKKYYEYSYRPRPLTLEEIGNIFKTTRQNISRIEIKQLQLLKDINSKSNLLEI